MIAASASRSSVGGILYAEDFDAPPLTPIAEIVEPIAIAPECFDRAALDAARHDGFLAGQRAAEADAKSSRETRTETVVSAISIALAEATAEWRTRQAALGRALADLVTAALDAVIPVAMQAHGCAEAGAALAAVLPGCDPHWDLVVALHPDAIDDVRRLCSALDRKITWQPEPALAAGDVRVAWRHGEFSRDSAAIVSAMRAAWPGLIADIPVLSSPIPVEEQRHVARV